MCACAFDQLASSYDATFTDTVIARTLREIVWVRLRAVFGSAQRVLELGCGTGEDAVCLAGMGAHVVATDAAPAMLEVARRKAESRNCAGRIEFHCLPMEELAPLGDRLFDGVLSNFGAVNCARDPPALIRQVARRLVPGAPLLWVLMGRHVPWEWAWFSLRGEWRKAWRRLDRDGVHWRGLTVSYPTPGQMSAALQPYFVVERVAPLGVVLPPSYAANWLNSWPRVAGMLTGLEWRAQRSSALARWSDHYIIEATRLDVPT